jgi:hypothetical protein
MVLGSKCQTASGGSDQVLLDIAIRILQVLLLLGSNAYTYGYQGSDGWKS